MTRRADKAPLTFGEKVSRLYKGRFVLSGKDRETFLHMLEWKAIRNDKEAVRFVDSKGEWLE